MSAPIATEPETVQLEPVEAVETVAGRSPRQLFWARFKQDKAALAGLVVIILLILLALLRTADREHRRATGKNELFGSTRPDEFGLPKGPSSDFLMGADTAGRDVFVRVIYGARTSLIVAIGATGIAVLIGIVLGLLAGYFGGTIDTIISRGTDIILSVPVPALRDRHRRASAPRRRRAASAASCKPGLDARDLRDRALHVALHRRIVRGNTLSLREREFIEASRSLGASHTRIMFREVLPNLVAPIIIYATLLIPQNILFEAALSFLGLGVPQSIPSWGRMLSDAARVFEVAWWLMVFPGLFLIADDARVQPVRRRPARRARPAQRRYG